MFTTFIVPTAEKVIYCVVIHGESLARMQNSDPAVLEGTHLATMVGAQSGQAMPFDRFDVMFCYEPNEEEFRAKCEELKTCEAVFHYLTRNWRDDATDGGDPIRVSIGKRGQFN